MGRCDAERTQVVEARIVLDAGFAPSDDRAAAITARVKHPLAAHEYPRAIEFVPDLPTTTIGKIIRQALRGLPPAGS